MMKCLNQYINEGISGTDWIQSDGCSDLLGNMFEDFNKIVIEHINHAFDYSTETITSFDVMNAILYIFDIYANNDREYSITEELWDILNNCWEKCNNDQKFIDDWKDSNELKKALKDKKKEIDKYKKIIDER